MISATLYNVLITDTIHPSMTIVSVITDGGTGDHLTGWVRCDGGIHERALVHAGLRHHHGAHLVAAGRVCRLRHQQQRGNDASTAPQITTTIPSRRWWASQRLALVKASAPPTSNTVGANSNVTYTVTITNWGGAYSTPAYDVVLTDTLPPGMRQTTPLIFNVTLNGAPVSSSDYLAATIRQLAS